MTFLRYAIYMGGGLFLTIAYVIWAVFDTAHATATWTLWMAPIFGLAILFAADRWIHAALFGRRIELRLAQYSLCPLCPFTGKEAQKRKDFIFSMHGFGPVSATMTYKLPILISDEADAKIQREEIDQIPGFRVTRFTAKKAVIYIQDKHYYEAFIAANERALI